MPTLNIMPSGAELFYTVDDFTDPWCESDAIVLLHGNAESGEAWRAWVPYLARRYKVVRPDMRGFGRSTPMPADFRWSADVLVEDLVRLASSLRLRRFHLVGAKIGATIALHIAAACADLVRSLCLVGGRASPQQAFSTSLPSWVSKMEEQGVRGWAASTMRARLGSKVSEAQVCWWTDLMAVTALSTQQGFMRMVSALDVDPGLPRIQCPTLVVTSTGSALGSVESTEAWQKRIRRSELVVVESDSYHPAGSEPDQVAPLVRAFIDRHACGGRNGNHAGMGV